MESSFTIPLSTVDVTEGARQTQSIRHNYQGLDVLIEGLYYILARKNKNDQNTIEYKYTVTQQMVWLQRFAQ